MEKYDDLRGLFDDVNNFKYKSVINNYSQLQHSTNYRKLRMFCVREVNHSVISTGRGASTGTRSQGANSNANSEVYTRDGKITIYKYIGKGGMKIKSLEGL